MNMIEGFKTGAGEDIELTLMDNGMFSVDCWEADGEGRWQRTFKTMAEAKIELERWRYLQAR